MEGEPDPAFKEHSIWELTMTLDQNVPNGMLALGREMLRNLRPDLIGLCSRRLPPSGDQILPYVAVDIGEAEVAAAPAEGE